MLIHAISKGGNTLRVYLDALEGRAKKEESFMQIMIAVIGICAAAMLLWYVYILMKGDDQA